MYRLVSLRWLIEAVCLYQHYHANSDQDHRQQSRDSCKANPDSNILQADRLILVGTVFSRQIWISIQVFNGHGCHPHLVFINVKIVDSMIHGSIKILFDINIKQVSCHNQLISIK